MASKGWAQHYKNAYPDMMARIEYEALKDHDKDLLQFREDVACTQALKEDYELDELIAEDIGNIYREVGYQDGMYNNFPISRVIRGEKCDRVYVLDSGGGVAIIQYKGDNPEYNSFNIVTLGEDDAYFFLNSRRLYEDVICSKKDFVYLLSEALSLFNNIK